MDELPETIFLCIVPQDFGDMNLEMTPVMREKISGYGEISSRRIVQVECDFGKSRSCMNCTLAESIFEYRSGIRDATAFQQS